MKPISKTFLKGLMAIIPITLTLYLLFWLAGSAEMVLGNIFKFFFADSWYITGLGFVLGLAVVFFVGRFLESQAFRRRFNNVEQPRMLRLFKRRGLVNGNMTISPP